jgi:hypothetical protein
LRAAAQAAGCWESEHAPALDLLRADASAGQERFGYEGPVLIDGLIDDGDLDAAWREAEGRAGRRQWLTLADLIRDARPAGRVGGVSDERSNPSRRSPGAMTTARSRGPFS